VSFLKSNKTDEYLILIQQCAGYLFTATAKSHVDLTRIQNIIDGTAQPDNRMSAVTSPKGCTTMRRWVVSDVLMFRLDLSIGLHALDAFQTTDRGLIYVDDTGAVPGNGVSRCVKIVNIAVGQNYQPVSLSLPPVTAIPGSRGDCHQFSGDMGRQLVILTIFNSSYIVYDIGAIYEAYFTDIICFCSHVFGFMHCSSS